jgi:formate dehydrogenase subunit gamma
MVGAIGAAQYADESSLVGGTALAQEKGNVPGNVLGNSSDAEIWRAVRRGSYGAVSIPDDKAAFLIQSDGESWRVFRNGPMSLYGGWGLLGVIVLISLFFAVRGRIRVEAGFSGRSVRRFGPVERFAHWLTATSFIVLALTGLNFLYGSQVVKPLIGPVAFATLSSYGKYAHDFIGFSFMVGIVLIVVMWVRENIPNKHDLIWLAKGGGLLGWGVHPPAKRFNAGQKIVFWLVVLAGGSLSITGLCLIFPFTFAPFSSTFAALNLFGFDLPTELTAIQEMQLVHLWHGLLSFAMVAVILAHVYIGWIGMEGAVEAMGTGFVDENWARQHHSLWAKETAIEPSPDGGAHRS